MQNEKPAALAHPIPAACARLSIGRTMLYRLIDAGSLTPIKIGAKTLIPEAEIQRYVADRIAASREVAA